MPQPARAPFAAAVRVGFGGAITQCAVSIHGVTRLWRAPRHHHCAAHRDSRSRHDGHKEQAEQLSACER